MKTAVVLFNLGGPDRAESVRPFLFNLFNDKAIINLPGIVRTPLAWLIAKRRAKTAAKIYDHLGGGSPLLENTEIQARALEEVLGEGFKVFICMRYWQPRALEAAQLVMDYNPDHIVLLPLYPQHSTTTTASSIADWQRAAKATGLNASVQAICCYPELRGFIDAKAELAAAALDEASAHGVPRLLFSAHGLPEKIVAAGDPYQWQCEATAKDIIARLGGRKFEAVSCYQSRVGPLQWIGPSTESEIRRAGKDGRPVVIVPIAFVSEHSETLVELDIEYRDVATAAGVPLYLRAATVSAHSVFIAGLADLVRRTIKSDRKLCSDHEKRICPHRFTKCPQKNSPAA